jgi:predicted GNAT family acetyltransferase
MPDIVDRPAEHRFVYEEQVDGHPALAELVYRVQGRVMIIVHTGVADELGGRGLGGRLVTAAIERAAAEGLTVRPDCPFARGWLSTHPEVASRVPVAWPAHD